VFGPEAVATRIDALVALGRKQEALHLLDRVSPASLPRRAERQLQRGELRASQGRWREAREDFSVVLLPGAGGAVAERALYGRALCASQLGDHDAARNDLLRYLERFPRGRFAPAALAALDLRS
jgi:tetratricopeptide (TPR) repeat protein